MNLGPYELGPNDTPENGIYCGDARELAKAIPDESVDLILTDPVFTKTEDYEWLAELGSRVLCEGGNLIAECGMEHLPQNLAAMSQHLDYVWLLIERMTGGAARMWHKRIIVLMAPYLWFSKGRRDGRWTTDCQFGRMDKTRHMWGDGAYFAMHYVARLTEPGLVVLDPFTGGATVPAVCKAESRQYLAFEIDPATCELARERVRNTQPPLFMERETQGELL